MQKSNDLKTNKNNCARVETTSNKASVSQNLPAEIQEDLRESFDFYDKEQTGYIHMQHFRNILHNFGFHKMSRREQDAELTKHD